MTDSLVVVIGEQLSLTQAIGRAEEKLSEAVLDGMLRPRS